MLFTCFSGCLPFLSFFGLSLAFWFFFPSRPFVWTSREFWIIHDAIDCVIINEEIDFLPGHSRTRSVGMLWNLSMFSFPWPDPCVRGIPHHTWSILVAFARGILTVHISLLFSARCPPQSSQAKATREISLFQVVIFQFVHLHPTVCCFPAPFRSFQILWLVFPALPFATFFPVFPSAFPPLPCYPYPAFSVALPLPATHLIDIDFGRREEAFWMYLFPPSYFPLEKCWT